MRVTPANIARFWKRLMFPPDTEIYRHNRLILKADLPWEPWLHATVWMSMIAILFIGEEGVVPPINGIDWYWLFFGLVSPPIGFFSVWALEHGRGTKRYCALWGRMVADAGLVVSLSLYELARWNGHEQFEALGVGNDVIPNMVLLAAMWFTSTLVWRDVRFIIATEKLAATIYRDVRGVRTQEWVAEWGADADR